MIDLHVKDEGLARTLQDRISELNRKVLLPALSQACDELVEPHQMIRIDRLEIDMGILHPEDLEKALQQEVTRQFRELVQRQVVKRDAEVLEMDDYGTKDKPSEETIPKVYSRNTELILFFLEYGILPWWHQGPANLKTIADEIVLHLPARLMQRMAPLLASQSSRSRISATFSSVQIFRLMGLQEENRWTRSWESIQASLRDGFLSSTEVQLFRRVFFDAMLRDFEPRMSLARQEEVFQQATALALRHVKPVIFRKILSNKEKLMPSETGYKILTEVFRKPDRQSIQKGLRKLEKDIETREAKARTKKKKEEPKEIQRPTPEDVFIEVDNAGIVLLWPYLEMYFRELGLLDADHFRDEASQWKAVHLLHYMAFGDEPGEEQNWALNKLLCGMEIHEFVPAEIRIENTEKEESEHLLRSLIRNWKALKNTSPEGLRQGFLRRRGIIKEDAHGHTIEIERNAFDVLLEKISWPISVVRLPWMERLIHVKW